MAAVGIVVGFFVVGLGILLLYTLGRFAHEKARDRERIARQWKNRRVRRWWVLNGLLFAVAVPLLMLVRDSDLLVAGERNSGIRTAVFITLFIVFQVGAGVLRKDRPVELPPTPKPFEGLRKALTAEGRQELQVERQRAGKGRSLWWLYTGLGLLVLLAIASPQCG